MLDTVGRLTRGIGAGEFVLVRDDLQRTGGYLIVVSSAPDVFSSAEVFDYWVEGRGDISKFVEESGWEVEWS